MAKKTQTETKKKDTQRENRVRKRNGVCHRHNRACSFLICCRGYSGHCVGSEKHTMDTELLINEVSAQTLETHQSVRATGRYYLCTALILYLFGSKRLGRLLRHC